MNNSDDFCPASNSEQYEKSNKSYQVENQVINKLCNVIIITVPDISHSQMSIILFRNTKARKSKLYFGFKSGIYLLIAPVPVHCLSITFTVKCYQSVSHTLAQFIIVSSIVHVLIYQHLNCSLILFSHIM